MEVVTSAQCLLEAFAKCVFFLRAIFVQGMSMCYTSSGTKDLFFILNKLYKI